MTTKAYPILRKNAHTYAEWMLSIQLGKTPDGETLTGINFVDRESELYVGKLTNNEFVGEAIFLGYQFEEMGDGFVKLSPESIAVHLQEVIGSINYREGFGIDICPREE